MTVGPVSAELDRFIETYRAERGDQVRIEEVAEVVASIMATIQGDFSATDLRLYRELDELAHYIQSAKAEIAEINPADINSRHLPDAADQLDAIVAATEEATGTLLEAAERIDAEARELGSPTINDEVIRIFEACSFQDLTGQRIGKVVTTMKYIEERLDRLIAVLGKNVVVKEEPDADVGAVDPNDERALLNGPQLPEKANKQEEIDALLASFD